MSGCVKFPAKKMNFNSSICKEFRKMMRKSDFLSKMEILHVNRTKTEQTL